MLWAEDPRYVELSGMECPFACRTLVDRWRVIQGVIPKVAHSPNLLRKSGMGGP